MATMKSAKSRHCSSLTAFIGTTTQILLVLLSARRTSQCDVGNGQPCFIIGLPTNVTYRIGESAELLCGVQEVGSRTVYWWKDGDDHPLTIGVQRFLSGRRISVLHKSGVYWNLKIDRVTPRDAGTYICKVSTTPTMQRTVVLHVVKPGNASTIGTVTNFGSFQEYEVYGEYQQSAPSNNQADAGNHGNQLGNGNGNGIGGGASVNGEMISVSISSKIPGPYFVDDRLFLQCSVTAVAAINQTRSGVTNFSQSNHNSMFMCDIEWFHNNNRLHSDRRSDVLITLLPSATTCRNQHAMVSTLAISRLRKTHSGKYYCNFKIIPPRDGSLLRSDGVNMQVQVFQKDSAVVDVHVHGRNATTANTNSVNSKGALMKRSGSAASTPTRPLCMLTFLLVFALRSLCSL